MKLPWNRDELGRELRAARPKSPAGLESAIEQDIETERRRSRGLAPRFRFGLAATATALVVASFTVAGGMAAASSSVQHALTHVAQAVHLSSPAPKAAASAASPAGDQYGRKKNCGKSARARENAALRAATRQLDHDLALAGKDYKQRVANARKLSAEKRNAALHGAYGRYVAARHAAYNRHAAAVKKAVGRYKADVKKCATA